MGGKERDRGRGVRWALLNAPPFPLALSVAVERDPRRGIEKERGDGVPAGEETRERGERLLSFERDRERGNGCSV